MNEPDSRASRPGGKAGEIERISAVTLFTSDMPRAVRFYQQLGIERRHGGSNANFTTFAVGDGALNLAATPRAVEAEWGRVVFHVRDVDAFYARARRAGLDPEFSPRDAPWGERYFHLRDPDGHELSFARPLPTRPG
jgi:catechol 2,3-dioxygenase-like lactoylglutathione lyase family enzyme